MNSEYTKQLNNGVNVCFMVIHLHPNYLAPIGLLIISKQSWGLEYDHKEETWHHLPIKSLCGWNWEAELDSWPPDEAAHQTDAEHPVITNKRQGIMYFKFRDIMKFYSIHTLKQLNSVLINIFYLQSPAEVPGTHCIGGWMDPRTGVDTMEVRKTSCTCWKSNPEPSVVQPTA